MAQTQQQGLENHSHGLSKPNQHVISSDSRATRFQSFDLEQWADVTGREEAWRFTPLRRLRGLGKSSVEDLHRLYAAPGVTVKGAEAVKVETVGRSDKRLGRAGAPEDRVAALAWAAFTEATVVTIAEGQELQKPVTVAVNGSGIDAAAHHLVIIAENFAQATVVIDHQGSATLAQNIEILVGDGAQLTVVSIQDWENGTVHLSSQRALVGRDARFKHVAVTFGGDVVRLTPTVRYADSGGDAQLWGLYFADSGQHLEQRLFVDHSTPNCVSRVTYKGALQGDGARTVWVGDVLIRKEAEGTDTYEINRNLVLSDGARADSVPNLEIETGLIEGAGHASATGRFDDEQLFYLMSRGIDEATARRLVVRGFLNEVIQQIGVPELQDRLIANVEAELVKSKN